MTQVLDTEVNERGAVHRGGRRHQRDHGLGHIRQLGRQPDEAVEDRFLLAGDSRGSMAPAFRFGTFLLQPSERRLLRDGVRVEVQHLVLELLLVLIEQPGHLWTREALHQRLWPDAIVSEDALFQAVAKARKALGDAARRPTWLATVPGQGYRFVGEVEEVEEVVADRPAPRPAAACGPLRAPSTSIKGREELVVELLDAVQAGAGLWTLTGPGGVGKTRLSREVGARVDLPSGALFCDLQAVTDHRELRVALGRALQLAAQRLDELDAALEELAARGSLLLILDNGEQIVEPLADVVLTLLRGAPQARLIVTSRLRLGLGEEHLVDVPPLPLPPEDADQEALEAAPASALLLERAAALGVRPGPDATHSTGALVRALGGLPLALELAAPRLRVLSPAQLLSRLDRQLDLLGGRGSDRPSRHATLRSAIATSWELLDDPAREALAQLSILTGAVSVDTAEAILDVDDDPLLVLADLVDHSLVRRRSSGLLELLPSIRDFSAEHLDDRGAPLDRLAVHYATQRPAPPERADQLLALDHALLQGGAEQAGRILLGLAPILRDQGPLNLLCGRCVAVRSAGQHPASRVPAKLLQELLCVEAAARMETFETDAATALVEEARSFGDSALVDLQQLVLDRLGGRGGDAAALGQQALLRTDLSPTLRAELLVETAHAEWVAARPTEAATHLAQVQALAGPDPRLQARIHMLSGCLALDRGRLEDALTAFEAAGALLDGTSARLEASAVHERIGVALIRLGRFDEGRQHFEEMGRLGHQAGSALVLARSRENLGKAALDSGDVMQAEVLLREAADTLEAGGHLYRASTTRTNLGQALARLGRFDEAQAHLLRALESQQSGASRTLGVTLHTLGMIALLRGDLAGARARMTEAVAAHEGHDMKRSAAISRSALGHVLLESGKPDQAVPILEQAADTLHQLDSWPAWASVQVVLGRSLAESGRPDQGDAALATAEAWMRRTELTDDLGRMLCVKGEVLSSRGQVEAASDCLAEARSLAETCQAGPDSELGRAIQSLAETLKQPG